MINYDLHVEVLDKMSLGALYLATDTRPIALWLALGAEAADDTFDSFETFDGAYMQQASTTLLHKHSSPSINHRELETAH